MAKAKSTETDAPEVAVATPKGDRQARWEQFLATARSQRPDPTIFDAQKAKGEFDTIPDDFK